MSTEESKQNDPPPPYTPPAPASTQGVAASTPPGNTAPYPTGPPTQYQNTAPYPPAGNPYPPNTAPYPTGYGQPPQVMQHTTTRVVGYQPTTVVVAAGSCPHCRVGNLHEQFSCCGILLAILFFPLGIICCLMMRIHVCSNCGAVV